jgi:hypothetical protein
VCCRDQRCIEQSRDPVAEGAEILRLLRGPITNGVSGCTIGVCWLNCYARGVLGTCTDTSVVRHGKISLGTQVQMQNMFFCYLEIRHDGRECLNGETTV